MLGRRLCSGSCPSPSQHSCLVLSGKTPTPCPPNPIAKPHSHGLRLTVTEQACHWAERQCLHYYHWVVILFQGQAGVCPPSQQLPSAASRGRRPLWPSLSQMWHGHPAYPNSPGPPCEHSRIQPTVSCPRFLSHAVPGSSALPLHVADAMQVFKG